MGICGRQPSFDIAESAKQSSPHHLQFPKQRWATGWTIGVIGFDSRRGLGIFLFTTASRTALEPTQTPIQWVPGALSLVVKRPEREADHSRPSNAEVKE
jgi:hypothetical protein